MWNGGCVDRVLGEERKEGRRRETFALNGTGLLDVDVEGVRAYCSCSLQFLFR